jgi:Fur family transcriptional regulator, ferric uptake regulator
MNRLSSSVTEEIDRRMSKAGLRWTPGRRSVVDSISYASSPLSMPDLQGMVGPGVPLSSLYRIIHDLLIAKVLVKLEFAEGFARFELDDALLAHHHHLVCSECGSVADLELGELERELDGAAAGIRKRTGFRVSSHRLDFFGLCGECARRLAVPNDQSTDLMGELRTSASDTA